MQLPAISAEFVRRGEALGVTLAAGGTALLDSLEPLWLSLYDHHVEVMDVTLPVVGRSETWPRRRAVYLQHLTHDDGFVLLARRDGRPVGYALVYLRAGYDDTWVSGARIAEVESLAVLSEERGHGLGTLLLDVVEAHLSDQGIIDVRLSVVSGNAAALAFYRARGMVPTLTIMGRHGYHPTQPRTQESPE